MRAKIVIIIFWYVAGLLVSELHQLVYDWPEGPVNIFLDPPRNLPDLQWVIKDSGAFVKTLFWLWAARRTAVLINQKLASIITVLMIYTAGEVMLYFLCYGVYGYAGLYCITGALAFLILCRK